MNTVLVTGGAGYVGSHACKAFAQAGWSVVVFDNLSRGWRDAVKWGPLIVGDIRDGEAIGQAIRQTKPDLVVHFAAFAYVGESVTEPSIYYDNNTHGTSVLLDAMRREGVGSLILSSTCATYGIPERLPIDEAHPQRPINPYGWSKLFVEQMLQDYHRAYGFNSVALRYFNAAGCDPGAEIGERHEPETHAIPLAIEAALPGGKAFTVMGTDFPTTDGTAVRDYIHVSDLAQAHLLAGEFLAKNAGAHVFNLGTGTGTSVLEILSAIEKNVGTPPGTVMGPRRVGDPAVLVASCEAARTMLGWSPRHSDIDTIVSTALAWTCSQRA